jgi:GNAT superfamily N-acetyltransferase
MISLLATYMEMVAPPGGVPIAAPVAGASISLERLAVERYLELYRRVGEPVQWDSRLRMPVTELSRWLDAPSICIHVLRLDGHAVGLCEFDGIGASDVELVHFGLDPAFHGQGFGSFLLDSSLRWCWSHTPNRIWLRTDTNDDPAAVHVYEKAGFVAYRREVENFED